MTGGRLSETFALLLREKSGRAATLSADAERAIRRRIRARWVGSIGAIVALGAMGTVTVVGAFGGLSDDDVAAYSPIPTPTIGVAVTTFPVAGGPEFVSAAAGLKCGDPAPQPHPKEHDVGIALTQTSAASTGLVNDGAGDMPLIATQLSQTVGTELGIVGNSDISLIIERDGVVAGVVDYGPPRMGWNALGIAASSQGQSFTQLVASWIFCPGDDTSTASSLEAGTYDVVAITRVFSTPEAVALYQALGLSNNFSGWNLDPAHLDPHGIYLPGSYDCAQSIAGDSPARACLPAFTHDAKFDAAASTVTMLYNTKDLVDDFSAVLVSEPMTIAIPGKDSLGSMQGYDAGSPGTIDSIDGFTCGVSAGSISITQGQGDVVLLSLNGASADAIRTGGNLDATAWATGVSDGSRIELLPGARIVYFHDSTSDLPDSNVGVGVNTLVASADVSAAQPVTTDRFAGPQPLPLTVDPLTTCPGIDAKNIASGNLAMLVGQWRIVTPDGTERTVDTGQFLYTD